MRNDYPDSGTEMQEALSPRRPSPLEVTKRRIQENVKELERLKELEKLLESNPDVQRIIELMGNKY